MISRQEDRTRETKVKIDKVDDRLDISLASEEINISHSNLLFLVAFALEKGEKKHSLILYYVPAKGV